MNAAAESSVLDMVAESALQLEEDVESMGWEGPFGSIYGLDLTHDRWAFFRRVHEFKERPDIEFSGMQMRGVFRHPSQRSAFKSGCAVMLNAVDSNLYRKHLSTDPRVGRATDRLSAGLIDEDEHQALLILVRREALEAARFRSVAALIRGQDQPVIVRRVFGEEPTVSNTPSLNFTAHLQIARGVLIDSQ